MVRCWAGLAVSQELHVEPRCLRNLSRKAQAPNAFRHSCDNTDPAALHWWCTNGREWNWWIFIINHNGHKAYWLLCFSCHTLSTCLNLWHWLWKHEETMTCNKDFPFCLCSVSLPSHRFFPLFFHPSPPPYPFSLLLSLPSSFPFILFPSSLPNCVYASSHTCVNVCVCPRACMCTSGLNLRAYHLSACVAQLSHTQGLKSYPLEHVSWIFFVHSVVSVVRFLFSVETVIFLREENQ